MPGKRKIYASREVDPATGEVLTERSRTVEQVRADKFLLLMVGADLWSKMFMKVPAKQMWFLFFLMANDHVDFGTGFIRFTNYDRGVLREKGCGMEDVSMWRALRKMTEVGLLKKVNKNTFQISQKLVNHGKATKWIKIAEGGSVGEGGNGKAAVVGPEGEEGGDVPVL